VYLDRIIRNFRGFEILSNLNDCIWITFTFKCVRLDRIIRTFVVNIWATFRKYGSICNFQKYNGQIWKFWRNNLQFKKYYKVNLKILKHMEGRNSKFIIFWCHLKFLKFNLDNILYKFPSFWENFKLIIQENFDKEFQFSQNISLTQNILHPNHVLLKKSSSLQNNFKGLAIITKRIDP
jgi:hypothetical protein